MSRRHSSATTLARKPRNPARAMSKVQGLRAQLADLLAAEDLSQAVDVLRGTLKATKHQAYGKHSTIEVPDHTSRLAAAKLVLEYAVGKPATVVELPDSVEGEGAVRATNPSEIIQRLKKSGLDLMDIVESYDVDEILDEDEAEQKAEDERIAKAIDGR